MMRRRPPRPTPSRASLRERADGELRAAQSAFLGDHAPGDDLWLFAYGSLLWNPEIEFAERHVATVTGWHRSFCLWQWRHRGSLEAPNLMLALDEGGSCRGVALRLAGGDDLQARLLPLWRRELSGDGYRPTWVAARHAGGVQRALTFVVNHGNRVRYAGRLPETRVAEVIAAARGEKGTGAEYLCITERALRGAGIFDRRLTRLRTLVAARGGAGRAGGQRSDTTGRRV